MSAYLPIDPLPTFENNESIDHNILSELNKLAELASMKAKRIAIVVDDHSEISTMFSLYAKSLDPELVTAEVGSQSTNTRTDARLSPNNKLIKTLEYWISSLADNKDLKVLFMCDLMLGEMGKLMGIPGEGELVTRLNGAARKTSNPNLSVVAWSSNGDEGGLSSRLSLPSRKFLIKKDGVDGIDRILQLAFGLELL